MVEAGQVDDNSGTAQGALRKVSAGLDCEGGIDAKSSVDTENSQIYGLIAGSGGFLLLGEEWWWFGGEEQALAGEGKKSFFGLPAQ